MVCFPKRNNKTISNGCWKGTIDCYPIIETKQASEPANTPLQFPTMTESLRYDVCLMECNNITRVISQCIFKCHLFECKKFRDWFSSCSKTVAYREFDMTILLM